MNNNCSSKVPFILHLFSKIRGNLYAKLGVTLAKLGANPKVASPPVERSPSSERRKTTGCGGGALGAPLWVALLPVQSGGRWNGMECLVIDLGSSPLLGLTLSLI
jgi:hypothetical protein